MHIQTFSVIGSGNIAMHLAKAFTGIGCRLEYVAGRNEEASKTLIQSIGQGTYKKDYDFRESYSDILILAVSDVAISTIARQLKVAGKILVHTAGSVPMDAIAVSEHYGVIYPLQTFTKDRNIEYANIPFYIEASSDQVAEALSTFAKKLSHQVYAASSEDRKRLHLSAVCVNNFVNALLHIGIQIYRGQGNAVGKNIFPVALKPLLDETIEKCYAMGPTAAQTGPARRNDEKTIKEHLNLLSSHPHTQEVYKAITNYIQHHIA